LESIGSADIPDMVATPFRIGAKRLTANLNKEIIHMRSSSWTVKRDSIIKMQSAVSQLQRAVALNHGGKVPAGSLAALAQSASARLAAANAGPKQRNAR
jgi:hypothetical protein